MMAVAPRGRPMTFLPESSVLITYSLACFVLFITPGRT